jgi:hypothetical protein
MTHILKTPEFVAYHAVCDLLHVMEKLNIIKGRSLSEYSRLFNLICDDLNTYLE